MYIAQINVENLSNVFEVKIYAQEIREKKISKFILVFQGEERPWTIEEQALIKKLENAWLKGYAQKLEVVIIKK
jgi:hypothetical protein